MKKRLTAMLLAVCMLFTFMPTAFAALNDTEFHIMDMEAIKNFVRRAENIPEDHTIKIYGINVHGTCKEPAGKDEPAVATGGIKNSDKWNAAGNIGSSANGKGNGDWWKVINTAKILDDHSVTAITIFAGVGDKTFGWQNERKEVTAYLADGALTTKALAHKLITEISLENATTVEPETKYNVTYVFDGVVPEDAPSVPTAGSFVEKAEVEISPVSYNAIEVTEGTYTFEGWAAKADGEEISISDGKFTMPAADVTVTGKWEFVEKQEPTPTPEDQFHYRLSEDSSNVTLYYTTDGKNIQNVPVDGLALDKGTQVAFFVKTTDGYTSGTNFNQKSWANGWNEGTNTATSPTGDFTTIDDAIEKYSQIGNWDISEALSAAKQQGFTNEFHYTNTSEIYRYREFTIKATPVEIKVEYDANGGTGAPTDSNTYKHPNVKDEEFEDYPTKIAISETVPTREGYTFTGWTCENAGDTVVYQADAEIEVETLWKPTNSNSVTYTFVAQWTLIPQPTNPKITGIKKELVTVATLVPSSISTDGITFPLATTILLADTTEVKLLYKVTVTGDEGAKYTVIDSGATCVDGSESGTIPGTGSAVMYFTKTFDVHPGENICTNTALIGTKHTSTVETKITVDTAPEPEVPEAPVTTDLLELLDGRVIVECLNAAVEHETKTYGWLLNGCEIGGVVKESDGSYTCAIKILGYVYAEKYNADTNTDHPVTVANQEITLVYNGETWEAANTAAIRLMCEDRPEEPEAPDAPVATDLLELLDGRVIVECLNAAVEHETKTYGWLLNGYEIGGVVKESDGSYTCEVKILGYVYAEQYNADTNTNHPVTVADQWITLVHDGEKWEAVNTAAIRLMCEDRPEEPEAPDAPVATDLLELLDGRVIVECLNAAVEHETKTYGWLLNGCEIGDVVKESDGSYTCAIKILGYVYAEKYNADTNTDHPVTVANQEITLVYNGEAWEAANTAAIRLMCEDEQKPVDPPKPPIVDPEPEKETFTVKFKGGNHGSIDGQSKYTYEKGEKIDIVPDVERDSSKYRFDGWYCEELKEYYSSDAKVMKVIVDRNLTFVAQWDKKSSGGSSSTKKDDDKDVALNKDDHFQYVFGMPDGTVRPLSAITRAEVAAIFYRLLDDDTRDRYFTTENDFPDVNDTMWYNKAVSTLVNAGILTGCPDGLFHGGRNITRAELATIIAKFDDSSYSGRDRFDDIAGHWARAYINSAAKNGWIVGDGTGMFRPYDDITRAEVMTMINAVLNRAVDEDGLCRGYKQWPDNIPGAWYYYQVIEATNFHDYDWTKSGEEDWNKILPDKIWDEAGR